MVFNILRGKKKKDIERRVTTFSEQLMQAFAQIKTDLSEVNNKIDTNQRGMERICQWIDYLNRSNQRLSDTNSRLLQKYEKIAENNSKLHGSHRELGLNHAKTAEMAENLKNRYQELSSAISAHKSELKSELHSQIQNHRGASEMELKRLKSWVDYLSAHIDAQKGKEGDLKQDVDNMQKSWLETHSRLRELLNTLKSENNDLKSSLSGIKEELQTAKQELENTKNLAKSRILEAKSELSEQIQAIKNTPKPSVQPPQQVQPAIQPIIQQVSPTTSSFQRHIISRVMPNRKGYVIKFILDLVRENKYSTKEIEEIVVNEKQLCGRTSFYAYLKELKLKGRLNYAEIDERTILVSTDPQQRLQE